MRGVIDCRPDEFLSVGLDVTLLPRDTRKFVNLPLPTALARMPLRRAFLMGIVIAELAPQGQEHTMLGMSLLAPFNGRNHLPGWVPLGAFVGTHTHAPEPPPFLQPLAITEEGLALTFERRGLPAPCSAHLDLCLLPLFDLGGLLAEAQR